MTAWAAYHEALLDVHAKLGALTCRRIARQSQTPISHTTVNEVLQGKRLPSWEVLRKTLDGMGADQETQNDMNDLWVAAYREIGGRSTDETPPSTSGVRNSAILAELRKITALLERLVEGR